MLREHKGVLNLLRTGRGSQKAPREGMCCFVREAQKIADEAGHRTERVPGTERLGPSVCAGLEQGLSQQSQVTRVLTPYPTPQVCLC